jgi:cysteine desulfurase family protein (TIGR01976 family)
VVRGRPLEYPARVPESVLSATTHSDTATVEEIRSHFPAMERRHHGHPVAYFDGPGGTQVPQSVTAAVSRHLLHHNANCHWAFPTSVETDAALLAARTALADLLGGRASEISFGPNMTTLTFHLGRALGRGWEPGDEVVVTELDHHANIDPWRAVARERDLEIRSVPFDVETGQLEMNALEEVLSSRTRLVAVGAASNALGTINDVARVVELARGVGARVFVDAVHSAPHVLTDVAALGCDFLACSAYKFYGPHVGILWGRQDLMESLDVPKLEPAPEGTPFRFETGTQNHEGIVGAAAAVDFLASLAPGPDRRSRLARVHECLHARGRQLLERLWSGLQSLGRVRLYGPPPNAARTPTLSFAVDAHTAVEVARTLADRGVFVSHGDFYALTVARRLGHAEDGLVRAGCACYTTTEEIDRLVEGVASLDH